MIHFVVGRHTQANANALVAGIKQRSDGHIPLFTSDELKHYDDAVLANYGIKQEFPRTGKPGRPRKPSLKAPKTLLYAQVVKRRKKGRIRTAVSYVRRLPFQRSKKAWFNNSTSRLRIITSSSRTWVCGRRRREKSKNTKNGLH